MTKKITWFNSNFEVDYINKEGFKIKKQNNLSNEKLPYYIQDSLELIEEINKLILRITEENAKTFANILIKHNYPK